MAPSFEPPGNYPGSASTDEHRAQSPVSVTCAVLTISDTRTKEDDRSGQLIRQHLDWRGHSVAAYEIVPDDAESIRAILSRWIEDDAIQAIVTNGGTGIAGRDVTYEAITGLLEKRLDGFGELFRMLTFEEIQASAMLTRATAGTVGRKAIFVLPGSESAVRLAMTRLILPELGHVVHQLDR